MPESSDQLRIQLDTLLADYERARRSLSDAHAKMRAINGRAESGDRLVTATVGPRGTLTALGLDPRAPRTLSADKLAEKILDTVQAAAADATRQRNQLLAAALPPGVPVEDLVRGEVDPTRWALRETATGMSKQEWWDSVDSSVGSRPQ